MDEDIMKAIEQVAQQASQNKDRLDIEAYIEIATNSMRGWASIALMDAWEKVPTADGREKMRHWVGEHGMGMAFQISQVARVLLRKELLGE